MRLVEYDETQRAHYEHETGRQTFHDVLTVDSVRHDRYLHDQNCQSGRN
jgi:hypothetical protein